LAAGSRRPILEQQELEMLDHRPLNQPIRVLLVDDHPAVRIGMRKLIDDQPDMLVVAEAASAREAVGRSDCHSDVAIVDYHLGGAEDGLWLTTELKRIEPPPRVLVYSAFADGALAVNAVIVGADGLLGKHELGEEVCSAIRRLARGRHNLPAVNASIADTMRSRLEPRDQAIFGMLLHGVAPETIAAELQITPGELAARRAAMLRSLSPARYDPTVPPRPRTPLDYERPRRRSSRRAA
jgi:DNA-binding NarL/FixJ family response regulator